MRKKKKLVDWGLSLEFPPAISKDYLPKLFSSFPWISPQFQKPTSPNFILPLELSSQLLKHNSPKFFRIIRLWANHRKGLYLSLMEIFIENFLNYCCNLHYFSRFCFFEGWLNLKCSVLGFFQFLMHGNIQKKKAFYIKINFSELHQQKSWWWNSVVRSPMIRWKMIRLGVLFDP